MTDPTQTAAPTATPPPPSAAAPVVSEPTPAQLAGRREKVKALIADLEGAGKSAELEEARKCIATALHWIEHHHSRYTPGTKPEDRVGAPYSEPK